MARSFILGKNQQYRTPEELAQARAAANRLLADQQTPTNVGSGLNAIGRALLYRSLMADAEAATAPDPVGAPVSAVTKVDPVAKALNIARTETPSASPKVAKALAGKPVSKTENPNLPSRLDFVRSDKAAYRNAIAAVESAGNGDYAAIGPTHEKYGRALGRYQVMEANLPQWSREALGREVTPDEFLANPNLQDFIFDHRFGGYIKKFGNLPDAVSSWFTGQRLVVGKNRKDSLGTTGASYVRKFNHALSHPLSSNPSRSRFAQTPLDAPLPTPRPGYDFTNPDPSTDFSGPMQIPNSTDPWSAQPDPARFEGGMDGTFQPTPQMLRQMLQNQQMNETQRSQISRQIERQEGSQGINLPSSVPTPAERHITPQNNFADPARFAPDVEPDASQPTLPILRQALQSPQLNETQRAQISRQIEGLQGNPDVELPQSAPIPSSAIRKQRSPDLAVSPPASQYGWLTYTNQHAKRSLPLSNKLISALDSFLPDMGVTMEVFSGGQEAAGPNRVGKTHRHDHGNAADVFFFKDGRRLDWANDEDRLIFEEIVRRGRAAGITGFGAGEGYMRPGSMHLGFGTPAVWGRELSKQEKKKLGRNYALPPEWLRTAFDQGRVPAPVLPRSGPIPSSR